MNEMTMLRDHRDAQSGPTPKAVAQARARLIDRASLAAKSQGGRRRSIGRPAGRPLLQGRWKYAVLATAVAGAAAAATVAPTILAGDDANRAFAAERLSNGTIKVTLRQFTDSAGLQRRLNALGVRAAVTYLPAGWICGGDRATIAPGPGPQPEVVSGPFQPAHPGRPARAGEKNVFYIHPGNIGPGQTLVWVMTFDRSTLNRYSGYGMSMQSYLAVGQVKPCKPIRF